MATKRISDLTAVNLVSGSAILPVVQDGATVKVTFADLTGSIAGLGGTAVTASYALTAETASYAVSASHEITYELSSSFAETATSASYATTAITASRLYKDVAPIYVGTQQKDSLAATEMTGEVITIKSNDDATSTPAYVVSNTDGTKFGSFGMQPVDGEVYLSAIGGNLNILSTTSRIKASGSLDIRDSLIVGEVLTLKPTHPLPSYLVPTGSFAVSASNPAKPYFWDGDIWNPLY